MPARTVRVVIYLALVFLAPEISRAQEEAGAAEQTAEAGEGEAVPA